MGRTTLAYGSCPGGEGAPEMMGQHTGKVFGRPFVLRLSKLGAARTPAVKAEAYWEIEYDDLIYPWRPARPEDEKDVPRLLADAATYLRGASQRAL
jgi:hypothetical protein